MFTGDGGGAGYAATGGEFDFGVDPNLDPELALALRMSMEEERARQEATAKRATKEAAGKGKGGEAPSSSQDATMVESTNIAAAEGIDNATDGMVCVILICFCICQLF